MEPAEIPPLPYTELNRIVAMSPNPEPNESETSVENQSPPVGQQGPTKTQLPVAAFQAFEKRDEEQILRELEGEVLQELVHTVNIGGRPVTSLSITGTRESARRRGNFKILDWRVDYTSSLVNAVVKIEDLENRCEFLGASSARLDQPFALTLALNKAERNALNKMLPAKWIASMIEEFLERRKTKASDQLESKDPPTQRTDPSSPSPTSASAKADDQSSWHVPLSKPASTVEGLVEENIFHQSKVVGVAYISRETSEVSLIPDVPPRADARPVSGFFTSKFLQPLSAKHPDFKFSLNVDSQGYLQAVLVRMPLEDKRFEELLNAAGWSFAKGGENK